MDSQRPRPKVTLTYTAAKLKAANYCAFQERSQQEVRDKLYSWGLHQQEVESLLVDLIEEGYLNEERFAIAYARGKHNLKDWGVYKIRQGLKLKSVSDPLIKIALQHLDQEAYREKLAHLLKKKATSLGSMDARLRKQRLISFALSKGYEQNVIFEVLSDNNLD